MTASEKKVISFVASSYDLRINEIEMLPFTNKKLLHIALCGVISGTLSGCDLDSDDPWPVRDWEGVSCDTNCKKFWMKSFPLPGIR